MKNEMNSNTAAFPQVRMRRLRQHPALRQLVQETTLSINQLVLPLFIKEGRNIQNPITSMPGHFQWSIDKLAPEINSISQLGIPAVMLFGIPQHKDAQGSASFAEDGVIQQAIRSIKEINPNLLVIADTCFCEYTDHGHCGAVSQQQVDNDATLALLVKQSVAQANAGADVIAPSGMMDGMVSAIRQGLDAAGHHNVPILSYSVKYASSFYGPFRHAAEGAPQFGDRSGYQMNPANSNEALREAQLDINEGADMIMVKPALAYLDIIAKIKTAFPAVPLAAYQVSGEFSMIKAASAQGWLDEKNAALESLTAISRAGADFIISYFAKDVAGWL